MNQIQSNNNINQPTIPQQQIDEISLKYEDFFRKILSTLCDDKESESYMAISIENTLIEFDRIIDEECQNRIKNTHIFNAQIINNFKQNNSLTQIPNKEIKHVKYDELISKIKSNLAEFNINH
jgi:hypothetical protein